MRHQKISVSAAFFRPEKLFVEVSGRLKGPILHSSSQCSFNSPLPIHSLKPLSPVAFIVYKVVGKKRRAKLRTDGRIIADDKDKKDV